MPGDGFLHRYFLANGGKRLHKWLHYFDIYERHFERFRNKQPTMIEIGVMGGGSLEMWKQYFGPGCQIVGIDIDPECKNHEDESIEIFIGSQDDPALIESIFRKYHRVDIVLDDGSHLSPQMIASFDLLFHRMSPTGVYVVEDTHANYWSDWGGGLRRQDTFIEFTKNKIDELHAAHARGALEMTAFTAQTDFITVYDSIVAFERKPQGARQSQITHGMNVQRDTSS